MKHEEELVVRILLLDDQGEGAAGEIGNAVRMLHPLEEKETSWKFSFGEPGVVSLQCKVIDDPEEAVSALRGIRELGSNSEYSVVLIDIDWTTRHRSKEYGLEMIEEVSFPRSYSGPVVAMFTQAPSYDAAYVARAAKCRCSGLSI